MRVGGRWIILIGLILVGALAALAIGQIRSSPIVSALLGNWDFVTSVRRDTGIYYRLKVKLIYKGEPQDFDIVVGCKVLQTNYANAGRTYEVGLTPSVFGRRMSDGKGLVVRPPRACRGETTANGDIPPDLLPLIVVYDDAETLAFGTAYLSDDAYQSPQSVLQFGGATIESADRAAFEKFRKENPNLVGRSSYHTTSGIAGLKELGLPAARIPMGLICYGYARFRLFGAEKEQARMRWPAERPRFWLPQTGADSDAIDPHTSGIRLMLTDHEDALPTPRDLVVSQLESDVLDRGMPRRHPVQWGNSARVIAPSYYADIGGWIALPWPADAAARAEEILRDGPHVGASIDFRDGAMRGFGYCRSSPHNFPTGASYPDPFKAPDIPWWHRPAVNYVDGIQVSNLNNWPVNPLIIERDEFIFRLFQISLQSTRGDV